MRMLAGLRPKVNRRNVAEERRRSRWSPEAVELVARVLDGCARRRGLRPEAARRAPWSQGRATGGEVVAEARREWYRLVRESWDLSLVDTAALCGVDHTTVLFALKRDS